MENNIFGIEKKIPPDATCFYCIHWRQLWEGLGEDFHYVNKGYCRIKKEDREMESRICKFFYQCPSMHTPSEQEVYHRNKFKS